MNSLVGKKVEVMGDGSSASQIKPGDIFFDVATRQTLYATDISHSALSYGEGIGWYLTDLDTKMSAGLEWEENLLDESKYLRPPGAKL